QRPRLSGNRARGGERGRGVRQAAKDVAWSVVRGRRDRRERAKGSRLARRQRELDPCGARRGPRAGCLMATGRDLAEQLLRRAADDEAAARAMLPLESVTDAIVGFHAQQAVEKSLKVVLAARRRVPVHTRHRGPCRSLRGSGSKSAGGA